MFKTFLGPAAFLIVLASAAGSIAAQHEGHVMPGAPQGGAGAPSAEQVSACVQSQEQVMVAADAANRRLDLARQSNQPAAMRAAMDDLQSVLSSMRTQLAWCAQLKAAAPQPGTPVMNPESTAPTGAPAAVRPAAPAGTADPHAGHVMPAAPLLPAAARTTGSRSPAAPPRASAAPPAAGTGGHDMANMPGHDMAQMPGGGSSAEVPVNLPTGPDKLSCGTKVDPKTAPRAAYAGKTYYFCSAAERDRFVKDPAAYRPGK